MKISTVYSRILASIALLIVFACFELGQFDTAAVFVTSLLFIAVFLEPRLGMALGSALAFLIQGVVVLFAGIAGVNVALPYAQVMGFALLSSAIIVAIFTFTESQNDTPKPLKWGLEHWAALIGPLFFSFSFIGSKILPGGNLYAWVMNNDAVNNILMVRDLVNDGGIILGEGGNPVPFTTSMLSLFLAGPNIDYSVHGNLQHDVIGMESFWFLTVVVLGLAAGLLAAELMRRNGKSLGWSAAAAGIASFATNMWFIIGYPIEYGFLNAALGLALLVISVLVFQFYKEHPSTVLGALFLASILILATWTPTVLFLVAFVLVIVFTQRGKLFVLNLKTLGNWIIPLLLALIFLFLVTIPSFIRTSSLLSAQGGVEHFPIALLWFMPIVIVTLSLMSFGLKSPVGWSYSAIGLTQLTAVGALLFLNRSLEDPWTYYPFKMLWFGSAFIALLSIPLALLIISRLKNRLFRFSTAAILTIAILLSLNWSIPKPSTFMFKGSTGILFSPQGELFNDEVAGQMFSNDQEGLVVYWVSQRGDQASALNFWNISNWANSLKPNVYDIRYLAYYLPPKDPALLCNLSELAKTELIVVTEVENLDQRVQELCPSSVMQFRHQ